MCRIKGAKDDIIITRRTCSRRNRTEESTRRKYTVYMKEKTKLKGNVGSESGKWKGE